MSTHYISLDLLNFEDIDQIIKQGKKLELSDESKQNITKCRNYLDQKNGVPDRTHLWDQYRFWSSI